tara:strand:+ start:252 stop:557 length:306 start_codon:yes stop_codon:yes gene_type:complete
MILWEATTDNGEEIFTCYNEYMVKVATISSEGDEWVFDLDPTSPGPLRVKKEEVEEVIQWATGILGEREMIEVEAEPGHTDPYMHFVDDEIGAVWQVWEVR